MKLPILFSAFVFGMAVSASAGEAKKLVLIAGKPSHPALMHEFRAGSMLLDKCLEGTEGLDVEVHTMGWVDDEATFADADAVVIYADGGDHHPALQGDHLKTLQALVDRGVGFGAMHFGVETPVGVAVEEFQGWIGGVYQGAYSCNPMWEPEFNEFPDHSITRGVKPFQIRDEWYFNMRFVGGIAGNEAAEVEGVSFTPILVAKPSDDVRDGPYVYPKGPYDHIVADSGRDEAMMWAVERKGGGRGFGFTGGHFHMNWAEENFRKVVLNALLWVSGAEVPEDGVASEVTEADLLANLDDKGQKKKKKTASVGDSKLSRRLLARGATLGKALGK